MTSQSCQRGPESAHVNYKGPCHTAVCRHSSSLLGCNLEPPNKHGGQSKPVPSSAVGSSWVTGLLRMLLLLLWYMPVAGGLEVKTEERQMVFLHDNVTVLCKIPGSPCLDITTVGIIWSRKKEWNESETSVYQFYGSHREAIRPGANVSLLGLERGDASLLLPRIELSEAGEYRCKLVVTPQKAEGTTRLDVVASPAMKLFVKPATERNGEEQHVICKLDGFYPEAFDVKWGKSTLNDPHFQAITEGIVTGPTVRNDDGTFSVTSSLALRPALEDHGNTFFCVVSHKSLLDSKRLSVMLPEKRPVEIYFTIVGPCVLLALVLALVIVYCLWRWSSGRVRQENKDFYAAEMLSS
ncbi:natural cytotoxicity triggering receptor 3 ligand 1-like [Peromyscus californicus insignis]|uniref:natural cytotoxicity triggering receptor 3 ligand 1-like n=1 Tax=Peromyscus californicus insignis TaxID=564181 RepID=UPI0022A7AFF8|nr:natural cytotoxicity triggering receptor 3 ligand 1-like [Peromyscus californicus insignis]